MAPGGGAGERQAAPSGGQPLNLGSRSLFKKQMILRNVIKEDCLKGDEGCGGNVYCRELDLCIPSSTKVYLGAIPQGNTGGSLSRNLGV